MPFSLTPNTHYFLPLKGCLHALNVLLIGLHTGEGFIKITGEVGTGKTLLCKKLIKKIGRNSIIIHIPNPSLSPLALYHALADELKIAKTNDIKKYQLLKIIHKTLTQINQKGGRVVLLIDEAQAMPDETLEAVRLITNFETETDKLIQVVLLGQDELDMTLNKKSLRQIKQRITLSYRLGVLNRKEIKHYVHHRIAIAGGKNKNLFNEASLSLLYKASQGIPRVINILCHKALISAFGRGDECVRRCDVRGAIMDTEVTMDCQRSFLDRLFNKYKSVNIS